MTRPTAEEVAAAQERIADAIADSLMSVSAFAIRKSLYRIFYVGHEQMEKLLVGLGYPKEVHREFLHEMFYPFNADSIFPTGVDNDRAAAWARLSAACAEFEETFEPSVTAHVDLLADMPLDYVLSMCDTGRVVVIDGP